MPDTCILVLLDGLGDRAHPQLDNLTPLQAAHTPFLDRLATLGGTGLYHAGKLGRPLPSEDAHFALFGSPRSEFPGRGPLEGLAADIDLGNNDVAMLAHFTNAMADDNNQLVLMYDRICGTPEEVESLFAAVRHYEQDGISLELSQTVGLFAVLTMRGDVSPYITDSNPMVDGRFISAIEPLHSHRDDLAAVKTANVLTDYLRWAYRQLGEVEQNKKRVRETLPPINCLVTQRAGRLRPHLTMKERFGLRGLSIASGHMYNGLAQYLGMDFHRVKNTRAPGNDMAERIEYATSVMGDYDLIHVHTKTPDQAGHSKNPKNKVKIIEALDEGLARSLEPLLNNDEVLIAVTADHSTPSCGALIHSGEPVPLMFVGNGVRRDRVQHFDEISVGGGCLGMVRGDEMMHLILNYLDRARLGGIHDTPRPQEFWPGDYAPFTLD